MHKMWALIALLTMAQAAPNPHLPAATYDSVAPVLPKGLRNAVLIVSKTNGWRHIEHIPHSNLALADIATQRRELTERARSSRLKPADMAGGTFTITNLGMYGIDAFNAIIAPPQAAILAVGRIGDRVVARNGQPIVRAMMTLTLSCDHRVVDGAQAAVFLSDLAEAIREPDDWLNG